MKKQSTVVEDTTPKLGSASKRLKALHRKDGRKNSLKQFAREEATPLSKEWLNNKNPQKTTKPRAPVATVTPITAAKKEDPKKAVLKKR